MMNWSEHEEQSQPAQRQTILPYWAVVLAVCLGIALAGALWSGKVAADPLFSATAEGATITLTNEPCAVKEIANLPYRATWVEKDKTYEGCYGVRTDIGVVIAYFNDRTVALIPTEAFKRVVGV